MFSSIFKRTKKNVFIHIPKSGGSTFVGLLKDSIKINDSQKKTPTHLIESIGNIDIKHVDFKKIGRPFKAPEIFDENKKDNYKRKYNLFMLVRNPVDRISSEFTFQFHILNGKNGNSNAAIISRLIPIPRSLSEYIKHPETQDYQCKFLLGRKIADPEPITEIEFKTLIKAIDELPIYCGTTDAYSSFLNLFQETTSIRLNSKITIRKKSPKEYKENIGEKLKQRIIELNHYDKKLYDYVKNLVKEQNSRSTNEYNFFDPEEFVV